MAVRDVSLAFVRALHRQRGQRLRRYPGPPRDTAGLCATVAGGAVQRDRGDRARPIGALDAAIDARRPGIGADRARLDPWRADPAIAKRADRLATDRGPRGRLDPAVRDRLYRVPAAGSAGLTRPLGRRSRGCADQPAIFFQPARANVVTLSRFLATTSQLTMTGCAVAIETVSATKAPPPVRAQPRIIPIIKRMHVSHADREPVGYERGANVFGLSPLTPTFVNRGASDRLLAWGSYQWPFLPKHAGHDPVVSPRDSNSITPYKALISRII